MLLLIDDAHWLDESSRGLTIALGRALGETALALALIHRPLTGDGALLPELGPRRQRSRPSR